ncbi:single-stranded DNA-binding protein [Lactococcus garvieae]
MLNTLIAEGRLVKDPTLKITDTNLAYSRATIASKRGFKNRETGKYESDFIQLYLTKDNAKNFAKLCHQGDLISIIGRLQTDRRVGKDGEVTYYTNVIVSEFTLLTKKKTEITDSNKDYLDKQKKSHPFLVNEPPIDTNFEEMNLPPTVDF